MTEIWDDILPTLLEGARITVTLTALAAVWGTVVAVILGIVSLSPFWPLRWLIRVYVEVLRGVSAVILLFWVFFVLPLIGPFPELTLMQAAVLAIGLNLSAYGTEIVRGAVQAVPRGQTEASVAINLSTPRRIWSVTLPQATVMMLPPYGNLVIEVMKASALVSLVGMSDIMNRATTLRNDPTGPSSIAIFVTALLLYFIIAQGIARVTALLERRFGRGLDVGRMARMVK